ncbi:MAG: response regulator [Thalassotalea sp.]|nr:response regulator [Thalassotalea sp.]
MKILIVEDDLQLAQGLQRSLRNEGYAANHVNNGARAILSVQTNECDIVILDLGLPDMDGLDVLKKIRQSKNNIPVLILTARDSINEKINGLDLGADDYLAKPFDPSELFARLRVLERRLGTVNTSIIKIAGVSLDTNAHMSSVDDKHLDLSRKEYMVLKALMENSGRIQSREQLESKLYEWGEEVASNAVEVHIHHLRKKLPVGFIKTVRGIGYTIGGGK